MKDLFTQMYLAPIESGASGESQTTENSDPSNADGNEPMETHTEQEEMIAKAQYDKLAGDFAKYKRDIKAKERARMTEDERKNAEAEDTRKELEELKKETSKSKAISKLVKTGAGDELVEELAQSLVDGDLETTVETIIKLVNSVTSEKSKELETLKLESTRRPDTGDNGAKAQTVEDFKKMSIDERIQLKINNPDLFAILSKQI